MDTVNPVVSNVIVWLPALMPVTTSIFETNDLCDDSSFVKLFTSPFLTSSISTFIPITPDVDVLYPEPDANISNVPPLVVNEELVIGKPPI